MEQHTAPKDRLLKMEQRFLFAKHQETHDSGDGISQTSGDGRALDAHVKQGDQHIVQDDVGHATCNGADQGQLRLVGSDQVQRKVIHEQDRDGEQQVVAQIGVAVAEHRRGEAHRSQEGIHQGIAQHR